MSEWITNRDTTLQILTRIYTAGYQRGHDETVESTYLHIHPDDVGTYFSDDVKELMQELGSDAIPARLIAAAPELLEALENLVLQIDDVNWGIKSYETVALKAARAAVAKAKGEQP